MSLLNSDMFKISELAKSAIRTIESNTTENGVIAALEGPGKEHKEYLHIWPRDTIFVALELKNFNKSLAEKMIQSIIDLPTDNGLFYQRYELDGLPDDRAWCNGDGARQLDQDALKFVALAKFPNIKFNPKKLRKSYNTFLEQIKSKKVSTDVWEQKRGYFFYTSAAISWGLKSIEKLIPSSKKQHRDILNEVIKSLDSFFDEKLKSFVKSPSEKIIDLEVVLGLNVLFESKIFNTKEKIEKAVSTLKAVEDEIVVTVGNTKIPIRYKNDFWNGEAVGQNGSGRPWPMGIAFISQTYSHIAKAALSVGEQKIAEDALKNANRWLSYLKTVPSINKFPEEIDFDGSLPKLVPKPLTWCAAEIIKAERLFLEARNAL